jgi:hypothetical protein
VTLPVPEQKSIFWQEFFCLWTVAVALAALSAALVPPGPAQISRQLFFPFHAQSARPLILALIIQNSLHLAVYVGGGLVVAHKLCLGAPILEAWLRREPVRPRLLAALLPISLAVVVIVGASMVSRASLFSPKRTHSSADTLALANSPQMDKALEELNKIGLGSSGRISWFAVEVMQLEGAVTGGLQGRLFEISVLVLLLQICSSRKLIDGNHLFWIAVLIVAVFRTVENVVLVHQNTVVVMSVFRDFGLPYDIPPIWSGALRTSVRLLPTGLVLGILYIYVGIEASILASFCAPVVSNLLTMFWLAHFR